MLVAIDHSLLKDSTGKLNLNIQDIIESLYMYNQKVKIYILCETDKQASTIRKMYASTRTDPIAQITTYWAYRANVNKEITLYYARSNKANNRVIVNTILTPQ